MARRSQCSSSGDNPLDPNYLPPHYREEYRLAIDALVEEELEGYYHFLQKADVVDFLSSPEIQYIQECVKLPQLTSNPEQRFLDTDIDGSSDTYWPVHSDLDAPGLDLGWPQLHHFIGPTEVTTLVNPPEPDMPSIKDQARRLIKNAKQVIAIVMDMFTDVDIFADILDAATRHVAVYLILDKQNAHHFNNMVSNCRVNLQSIQFLRVRTVSGITYQCRSGKSFKGQMMDRFLLTDCRAVLSGNYSFMWSFEKLHRCMAHLFLGQLVSTFDEEFRILFAQSEPLTIENALPPMEDFNLLQSRQYPSERTSLYREPNKFKSLDTPHPDEWGRHSYDEHMDMDWRLMPLKRQESLRGAADMSGRFPPQQSRLEPSFDQGPSRMPMMENPAFQRHSYAEGGHGRYSSPFLQQQGMPEPENQGRQFHREQQPYPGPGKEPDYSANDKFWSQGYHSADQYSEPGLPQEMEPPDFDPVLNYLSSTRNVDFDQGSEKLPPIADVPFSSPQARRLNIGQRYACQTSPTPSNPTDQKQFFQEPNTDRKDPVVKRGLRDWRISSYLSAYDNPGDEGLPLAPPNAPDPFEEQSNPIQQTAPGIDLSFPKIPNVREFKVPALPRASQMPSYAKTTAREPPNKLPDERTEVATETKSAPTPSESSSTTEGEKTEEAEQKEPKTFFLPREDSFRRKYNAAAPRSSRLRSSLIFSSLEQQHTSQDTKTAPGQQDEESDKNEAEQTKPTFLSQVLGQKRATAREPFEWSRYKSSTFDNSATDSSTPDDGNTKADDKDSSKEENPKGLSENNESLKPSDVEQANSSPSMTQFKPSEAQLPKTEQPLQPPMSLFSSSPYVDMNDPDNRLTFFKQLAAQRKAAKAAEAEKSKEKAQMKPPTELKNNTTLKKEELVPKEMPEKMADTSTCEGLSEKNATTEDAGKTVSTETCKSVSESSDGSDITNKEDSQVKNDPNSPQSCKEEQSNVSTDSEKIELKNSLSATTLPVSAETKAPQSEPPGETKLSNSAVKKSGSSHPPTPTNASPDNAPFLAQSIDESERPCHDSTSKMSGSLTSTSVDVPPSSAVVALDSNTQKPESVQLETSIFSPPLLSEQHTGSECISSNPSVQNSSSDGILQDCGPQISPSPSSSSSAALSTPAETIPSNDTPEVSSLTLTSSMLTPKAQQSLSKPAKAEKSKEKAQMKPPTELKNNTTVKNEEPVPKETLEKMADTLTSEGLLETNATAEDAGKTVSTEVDSQVKNDPNISQTSTDSEKIELKNSQSATTLPGSAETEAPQSKLPGEPKVSNPAVKESSPSHPPTPTNASPDIVPTLARGTDESESLCLDSTSKKSGSPTLTSVEVPPSSAVVALVSNTKSPESVQSSSFDQVLPDSGPQIGPIPPPSSSAPLSDPAKTIPLNDTPEDSSSTLTSSVLSPNAQESVSPSPPEPSPSVEETSLKSTASSVSQTDPESAQGHTDSVSQLTSSEIPSVVDLARVESYIPLDTCAAGSEPNTSSLQSSTKTDFEDSCAPTPEKDNTESENNSVSKAVEEESEVHQTSKDVKADSTPATPCPLLAESCLTNVSGLESKSSSDQNEIVTPTPSPADPSPVHPSAETGSPVPTDITSKQSETTASPQDALIQAIPPPDLNLTQPVTSSPAETVSVSPLTKSVGLVLSPEAEKTTLHSLSDTNSLPEQVTTDSNKTLKLPLTETSCPTEPTPKVQTESDLPCKTPESVSSETLPSEPPVPAESSKMDSQNEVTKEPEMPDPGEKKIDDTDTTNEANKTTTQESVCNEKTNDQVTQNNRSDPPEITPGEVVLPSPQPKQPKSSQSRYQSSTANVLSSSNLRDDTKLLLGQISANSQSRNEATKESPVTDDEKEDKADKDAKREKERGIRSPGKAQPKSSQEREQLLQKMHSMRRKRKVYSRFEMTS